MILTHGLNPKLLVSIYIKARGLMQKKINKQQKRFFFYMYKIILNYLVQKPSNPHQDFNDQPMVEITSSQSKRQGPLELEIK
jgi:hypothetical protein